MPLYRRILFTLVLGLILIVLQATLLKSILPHFLVPNLLIILVVFLAFFDGTPLGAGLSFLLGLELDIYNGILLGPWAGSYVVVYGVLAFLSQRIFVETALAAFVVVLFSSLLANLVYVVLTFDFRPVGHSILLPLLLEAALSGVIAPAGLALLRRLLVKRGRGSGAGRTLSFSA